MKMNNKGFSLVELIVVIAIMAILVGVLAPSVTGQVDKSRKSKDDQNLDGLASAMATAITDDLVSSNSTVAAYSVSLPIGTNNEVSYTTMGCTSAWASNAWFNYLGGKSFKIESNTYKNSTVDIDVDDNFRVSITVKDGSGNELLSIVK
jgi:type IV pilus assembly protein PilA